MNASSLTPEEIRAAAETHNELGQQYQSAVIDSFIEKVGREIDARVDARIAGQQYRMSPAERAGRGSSFALAVTSLVFGIPLTAIALGTTHGGITGLVALIVIWLGITAINVASSLHSRPASGPPGRR